MAKAEWNGVVLAESERDEVVQGNVYFPPESLRREHLRDNATHTVCGWKGTASQVVSANRSRRRARRFASRRVTPARSAKCGHNLGTVPSEE